MHRHWFEIVIPRRFGAALILTCVVWAILALLFTYLMGAFEEVRTPDNASGLGTGLFFASTLVYGVVAGAWVIRRSVQLVTDLPLTCDAVTAEQLRQRISGQTRKRGLITFAASLIAGSVHNMFLQGGMDDFVANITNSPIAFGGTLGTMLAWLVITHVVVAFVQNAETFAEIGKHHLAIDLLHPEQHSKLGRAALLPTLGLIGTQMLYPLLWLGGQVNIVAVIPGSFVTLVSLVYLFVRTTLPLHRRLAKAKALLVAQANERIDELRGKAELAGGTKLVELQATLDHRSYLQSCPEWPFKLSTIVKWSLYLLIPPLTWVGAALIENVVDFLLA